MSTELLLVRHAACERMAETLVGRGADVALTTYGRKQLAVLAQTFTEERRAGCSVAAIYCSPRLRTRQTAEAVSLATCADVTVDTDFDEVDFGEWTGQSFVALHSDERWTVWNTARSRACAPRGESMLNVQRRVVERIEALAVNHSEQRVVIVSHSEIIRTAILYYLGLPLDAYSRLEISPASRSQLSIDRWGVKIVCVNDQVAA